MGERTEAFDVLYDGPFIGVVTAGYVFRVRPSSPACLKVIPSVTRWVPPDQPSILSARPVRRTAPSFRSTHLALWEYLNAIGSLHLENMSLSREVLVREAALKLVPDTIDRQEYPQWAFMC